MPLPFSEPDVDDYVMQLDLAKHPIVISDDPLHIQAMGNGTEDDDR